MSTVSVIVPVLHEPEELERLLESLAALSPAPTEVIVVDGSAGEDAGLIAARHGALHLATHAGRGHQLDRGARRACGEVLWFLHADAEVEAQSLAAINRAIADGAVGGWFRFSFRGPPTRRKRALAALINMRCALGGIPYGDQALFATRAAYAAAGGFPATPLFEEVPLVKGLRRQGPFAGLRTAIGVSSRRWERDGWLRRTVANRMLALGYALGVSPERLARIYR